MFFSASSATDDEAAVDVSGRGRGRGGPKLVGDEVATASVKTSSCKGTETVGSDFGV